MLYCENNNNEFKHHSAEIKEQKIKKKLLQQIWDENSVRRKSKTTMNLKTGRFDNIDQLSSSAVYARQLQNFEAVL